MNLSSCKMVTWVCLTSVFCFVFSVPFDGAQCVVGLQMVLIACAHTRNWSKPIVLWLQNWISLICLSGGVFSFVIHSYSFILFNSTRFHSTSAIIQNNLSISERSGLDTRTPLVCSKDSKNSHSGLFEIGILYRRKWWRSGLANLFATSELVYN